MARKKETRRKSEKTEEKEKFAVEMEQLQLFAAFRDIWQAPVP